MRVLIVESDQDLGRLWKGHLTRSGAQAELVSSQQHAVERLAEQSFSVLVINLELGDGSAFAVADYANYRRPDIKVIFVTNSTFFSDGSIFQHVPNVCAFLPVHTRPEDLVALVEHHGARSSRNR